MADSGELIAVFGTAVPGDRFAELALRFTSGTLMLSCEDETDEVRVSAADSPGETGLETSILDDLLGMSVECAWELTNQRGYADGFQLRLTDRRGREETRQFEVAASAMDVRRVG